MLNNYRQERCYTKYSELCSHFETPRLKVSAGIEAYVDGNMIEVFVNEGENVITNAVYDLSDTVSGNYEIFGLS